MTPPTRTVARDLYAAIKDLPIISPHGHTDPRWYAENALFPDPAQLLIVPDHYIFRMLFSQGVRLEDLGVPTLDGSAVETDGRKIWRIFAENYYLFRGTPTRLWLDYTFANLFGLEEPLTPANADRHYDAIAACCRPTPSGRRAPCSELQHRGDLDHGRRARRAVLPPHDPGESGWSGRVVPAYRPDAVIDPDFEGFGTALDRLAKSAAATPAAGRAIWKRIVTAAPISSPSGRPPPIMVSLRRDRQSFGAEAQSLFDSVRSGRADERQRALFRAQMLTEMAKMSAEDGLVMQIHPGSWRNHSPTDLQEVRT